MKSMVLVFVAVTQVLLATLFLSASATAQEKLIADRVFLVPDPKSTSIQFQMIVLAGSADETNMAQLGIAHYLEHLVLVGRNEGHAEAATKFFADGSSNGSTSQRVTSYIHRFPASASDVPARLDKLFKFYSERLTDFAIDPAEAIRERNVVRQEHDWRYASSPTAATMNDVGAFMFRGHPFAKPTIGTPETIAAFTTDESRAFLRRWYRKANVYFIVTGPMPESLVKETADKHLTSLDSSPPPERAWLQQKLDLKPESQTFRLAHAQIANPSVYIQKIIPFDVADPVKAHATKHVLTMYLGSKLTGSPNSALVEGDRPVASAIVSAGVDIMNAGAITWSLGSVPEEGRSIEEQLPALRTYLSGLVERGIDAAAVERLKKRYVRDYKRYLEEPQNAPGRLIAWLTQPMPYQDMARVPEAIAAVTADDVNAMLKALLSEGREAVIVFEPKAP